MKKIPSLYKRNYSENTLVYDEIVEGCEWVFTDETSIATVKHDGTACLIKNDKIYKRYDAKAGRKVPENAIPCQEKADEKTGHFPHWVECNIFEKNDKWHFEALNNSYGVLEDGSYELCGPKINGNKELLSKHHLIKHGIEEIGIDFKSFDEIKEWLKISYIEGIVWHNSKGNMVKIKRADFGFKW